MAQSYQFIFMTKMKKKTKKDIFALSHILFKNKPKITDDDDEKSKGKKRGRFYKDILRHLNCVFTYSSPLLEFQITDSKIYCQIYSLQNSIFLYK